MTKIFFFFFLLAICACTSRPNNSPKENAPIRWQYVTLEFNDTVIQLAERIDTLELTAYKEVIQKYQINKTERDSLFIQANELIENKGQPKRFCTDYVGRLKVRIKYNSQLLKEVTFSSICNWRELGPIASRIDHLLKRIVGYK